MHAFLPCFVETVEKHTRSTYVANRNETNIFCNIYIYIVQKIVCCKQVEGTYNSTGISVAIYCTTFL